MSAPSSDFLAMRAGLVERGLISADFALTEAGEAYVFGLIDGLKRIEAEPDYAGPRVRWNFGRNGTNA